MYHSKIIITPENQDRYRDDPRFQEIDEQGRHFATIGAGPVGGLLNYGRNRPNDVAYPDRNRTPLPIPPCYANEDEAIEDLFRRAEAYQEFPVPYELFPGDDGNGFNSNSFVSGLLQAACFTVPDPGPNVIVPGYHNPVPPHLFE